MAERDATTLADSTTLVTFNVPFYTDKQELASMAAAFATLPCKVLWRLTPKEVPDQATVAALNLGTNTQAGHPPPPPPPLPVLLSEQQSH